MSVLLEQEVANYSERRTRLASAIADYAEWLDRRNGFDGERTLRLSDIANGLRKDHLVVAFVAEFSRGKTELINALFFADHGQRLLPSDVGRTTMCPTELYFNPEEPTCLGLLPIETRGREESLGRLLHMPEKWSRVTLSPEDPGQLQEALRKLTETKMVAAVDAIELGLWNNEDPADRHRLRPDGTVEIPAWRYARVNFPHPLLRAGLTILDTPGLNALGAEPELTLSVIPNAHAVIYLLATDTGVTRSDLEIWQKHVHRHSNYHVAVLNKIDMLWDDLKSESEIRAAIERQAAETAHVLKLPASQVFAVSAQKALVAKIRGDQALRQRSGIDALEHLLARQIIPARRDILHHSVTHEIVLLLEESRISLSRQLRHSGEELVQLTQLSGKNRKLVEQARARMQGEKELYDATAEQFKLTHRLLQEQGELLLSRLSEETFCKIFVEGREAIEKSWTTHGLINGISGLTERSMACFQQAMLHADTMLDSLERAYVRFHKNHNLPEMQAPRLDLRAYQARIENLAWETEQFCRDPANLMLEKNVMIRRYYAGLAEEARKTFDLARKEAERWLRIALDPVVTRILEHKLHLDRRLTTLKKVLGNTGVLHVRMSLINQDIANMRRDKAELDKIAARLVA
jgi:hypothetical protein